MIARVLSFLMLVSAALHAGQRLDVELLPCFGGRALAFDTLSLEIASGQRISLTRCDLLLTRAELQDKEGKWTGSGSWAAFVSLRDGRTRFALTDIPPGRYTRLCFRIGVPAEINHADPAVHPAGHPLNPAVNNMHWSWQGGYIFAAIEGLWRGEDGALSGYSFHVANDPQLMTVDLPCDLDLRSDRTLKLAFDVSAIFSGIALAVDGSATHSRPGDPLAGILKKNLPAAIRIDSLRPTPTRAEAARISRALISPTATPFRFRYPAAFPRPSLPGDNPLTEEGVRLGRELFHDTSLSGNRTQSCASCHHPHDYFSDPRRLSAGAYGDTGTRHSMPLFNLAWKSSFFWDGRASPLRKQVLEPIENPVEMHAKLPQVVSRLIRDRRYPRLFEDAFGTRDIDADRLSRALEQFLLSLVSGDSKFDRAARGQASLTAEEQRGAELFHTEYDPARGLRGADCFHCHGGPLFQSAAFANNGLPPLSSDTGRHVATGLDGDRGKFAVPSLRNVARTAPYMHDGRFATLEEVIDHYDQGIERSPTLDPNLAKHPAAGLGLTPADKAALVAFLKTLTDHGFPSRPPGPPR